jgi:hypothetical protein
VSAPYDLAHVPARPQSWSSADPDIAAWVEGIVAALADELADELVDVYLHGSLAMGSYHRPKSDLDLLVIVRERLPPATRGAIGRPQRPNLTASTSMRAAHTSPPARNNPKQRRACARVTRSRTRAVR